MAEFRDVEQLIRTLRRRADALVQEVGEVAVKRAMRRTPVKTGSTKANWRATRTGEREVDTARRAKDIPQAAADALAVVRSAKIGDDVEVYNAHPVAAHLEYGSDTNVPHGMARVTARELRMELGGAVRRARQVR